MATIQLQIDKSGTSTRGTADPSSSPIYRQRHPGTYEGFSQEPEPVFVRRYGAARGWEVEPSEEAWHECEGTVIVAVAPEAIAFDFGPIPTIAEPKAEVLLSRIPWRILQPFLEAIRLWIDGAPVSAVRLFPFSDPDVDGWEEVVLELTVDADTPTALTLWRQLAERIDVVTAGYSADERRKLNRSVAVHLDW